jgi:hypothetical protein
MEEYVNKSISLPKSSWKLLLLLEAELDADNRSRTVDMLVLDKAKQLNVGDFNAQKQPEKAV